MVWFNVSQMLAWCGQNVPFLARLCRLVTNVALTFKKKFPFSLFLNKCGALVLSFTIYSIPEVLYLLLCAEGACAGEQSWFVSSFQCVLFSTDHFDTKRHRSFCVLHDK